MQTLVNGILESRWLWLIARILMIVFTSSGLAKVIDFEAGMAEMRDEGLEPAWLFNLMVAITLLAGSILIILDRMTWLGAGMLSVFLLLTIMFVHHFWSLPSQKAQFSMLFALEHTTVIGGLMATAIASHLRQRLLQQHTQ